MLLRSKLGAFLTAVSMVSAVILPVSVYAKNENFDVIFDIVTDTDATTLPGEAKFDVSVSGINGDVTKVNVDLGFDGDLEYKTTDFEIGENDPAEGKVTSANVTSGNNLSIAVISLNEPFEFSGEMKLFTVTFKGDPGDGVKLSLDKENTWIEVDGKKAYASKSVVSEEATATENANEATEAVVKIVMDKVRDYRINEDMPLTLSITNERTGKTITTVITDANRTKPIPLTYTVTNDVLAGDKYTVELSSIGYKTVVLKKVDFEDAVEITNSEFVPGDINKDGEVDDEDAELYTAIKNNAPIDSNNPELGNHEYNAAADFNRDGFVDENDNVFENYVTATVPTTPDKPTVKGGEKKITVTWKKPSDGGSEITGYIIKYGTDEKDLDKEVEIKDGKDTEYTIKNLKEDQKYYVAIAAVNEIGESEFSKVASATTDDAKSTGGGGGGGSFGGGSTTTQPSGGTTTSTTPSNPDEPFTDLGGYDWAKDSIYSLKDKGIISGTSDTTYSPANNIKRGDFILILTRMLGITDEFSENFADVPAGMYYYNAIGSAKAAGIATGDGQNFMPENTITRQDLITLAYRAFLAKGYISETADMSSLDAFGDRGSISGYAETAMASMVSAGIIKGSDGNVNPLGNATRAEVAVMCARLAALMN